MKRLRQYICEAKFKGLNADELKVLDDELKEILKNESHFSKLNQKNNIKVEYGHKYYVEMNNPFADTRKFSANPESGTQAQQVETDGKIQCIGIGDKFGRIFLQNVWEFDEPAYIEYKKAEKKVMNNGYVLYTKEGWYITRKKLNAYKVKKWFSGKRGESPFYFTEKNISNGIWGVNITDCIRCIFDLSDYPEKIDKIFDKIKKDKESEEKRKEAEANNKKFWDERKDYKNYGLANTWGENTPEEVKKAWNDKNAKWFYVTLGNCYREEWCDTYKLYYSVDSSD